MDYNNTLQINLKEALKFCRDAINGLNENTLVAILRKQSVQFNKALDIVEQILSKADVVLGQDAQAVGIRAATMFIIALWSKMHNADSVDNLTKDDWRNILGSVYEQAVDIDPVDFTQQVFNLYKRSIAYAIEPMKTNASPSAINRLEEIVSLMEEYAASLESRDMPEVKYIEENLWLSLEAVFLVMTDRMSFITLSEERHELAEAVGALVFQKLRYSHYDKELVAVDECLEHQEKLDRQLTERVNVYIDALREELDEFDALVEIAFNTSDFQTAFRGSADLAEFLGVEEVLRTQQDIDDYFNE